MPLAPAMRDTLSQRGPAALRRGVSFWPIALLLMGSTACSTPSTHIRLPACAKEISVSGQHTRGGRTTLILDHSFDLPLSRTQITVERIDGTTRQLEVVNASPDWWRLLGGSLLGTSGAALLTRYGYGVGAAGEDPIRTPWLWALPCGLALCGVGSLVALTGWHPSGDTVIEDRCAEVPPKGVVDR